MFQSRRQPSLRLRWLSWRARLSIPSLLAGVSERKVVSLFASINGGLAILIISLFAWISDLPLVFPALGPTVFILFHAPFSPAAAPRSVIVGQFTGIASGCGVWHLMSYLAGETVSLQVGGWPAFFGAALALAVTCLLLVRFSCPHPPACGSALVVALGGVPDWWGLLAMTAAVVLVTAQAICIYRIACVRVPTWSPRDDGAIGQDM